MSEQPEANRPVHQALPGALLLLLGFAVATGAGVPGAVEAQQVQPGMTSVYTQLVASHFGVPSGEAQLLVEDLERTEDLPVVLILARESGLSPSVILSRRQRGAPAQRTPWLEVARQVQLGGGVFYVEIAADQVDDRVRRPVGLFEATPQAQWAGLDLTDDEVVDLTHVKVLSRHLTVEKGRVLEAREAAGSWVGSIPQLMGVP